MQVEMKATLTPTNNDISAATIVLANISLPKLSVPNQCDVDGANSLFSGFINEGDNGNHSVAANVASLISNKLLISITFRLFVNIIDLLCLIVTYSWVL